MVCGTQDPKTMTKTTVETVECNRAQNIHVTSPGFFVRNERDLRSTHQLNYDEDL
jgi:hypothetical protein